ncbi:DUF2523 domain-containing protein [Ralstonia solanacearum]|uniref:DUF2523 domain-containing protein n=1 Tax=Ralstonia solanacearum TaxID=305 RepID=UPI000A973351|nr:DUF2523 domain-containing protein [Ralstonia solanacearum]
MFDAVINALSALAQWLDSVFVAIFTALWQISEDLFIDSLDLLLQGVTAVLNTLPAPTFLSGVSLQAAFSSLGGDILFSSASSTSDRASACWVVPSRFVWRARS